MRFHGNQFSKRTTPRIEAKRSDRRCNSRIIRISNKQNNICLLSLWRYRTGTLLISSSFATVFALSPWIIKSLHQVAWDNLPLSSQKLVYYRELKHQRRRPLQIRYLKKKSEFALPQSNFIALIPSCLIRQTFFFFFARARACTPRTKSEHGLWKVFLLSMIWRKRETASPRQNVKLGTFTFWSRNDG